MRAAIEAMVTEMQLEFLPSAWEPRVACEPANPNLKALLAGNTAAERHYIPSIDPYSRALEAFAVERRKVKAGLPH